MEQDQEFVARLDEAVEAARSIRADMREQVQRMRATMERLRDQRVEVGGRPGLPTP